MKVKGKRKGYTQLNAEFQRIAKKYKKAFLRKQCKEIEKIIEWERLEIFFFFLKKIRHTKGIFHAKMDTIKDRNTKGLTETEEIRGV